MIVVDASVLANVVADDGADGHDARALLVGEDMSLPDLADVEVASVLRRRWLGKTLGARRFAAALEDLAALPARRFPTLPLLGRAYELRANVSPYDAVYVALAEALGCRLLTGDGRLARSPGLRCAVTLVASTKSPR